MLFTILFWTIFGLVVYTILQILVVVMCIAYICEAIAYIKSEVEYNRKLKAERKMRAKLAKNNPDYVFIEV